MAYISVLLWIISCLMHVSLSADSLINMSTANECSITGRTDIGTTDTITIIIESLNSNAPGRCTRTFRAKDPTEHLKIEFREFDLDDCNVQLQLIKPSEPTYPTSFNCRSATPLQQVLEDEITIEFTFTGSPKYYKLEMRLNTITAPGAEKPYRSKDDRSIGTIVGIVGGILGFIAIVAIIFFCCWKNRQNDRVPRVLETDPENVGYTNDGLNGHSPRRGPGYEFDTGRDYGDVTYSHSLPQYKPYDNNDYSKSDIKNKPDLPIEDYYKSPKGTPDHGTQVAETQSKSPMVNALKASSRFQTSSRENDAAAEKRRERFSDASSGNPDRTPSPPPALPKVPTEQRRAHPPGKHASIRRAYRPASSFEEMQQVGLSPQGHEDGDTREKRVPNSPDERYTVDENGAPISNEKSGKSSSTHHGLKPNRKSPGEKQKTSDSDSKADKKDTDKSKDKKNKKPKKDKKLSDFTGKYGGFRSSDGKVKIQGDVDKGKDDSATQSGVFVKKKGGQKSPRLGGSLTRRRGASLGRELDDDAMSRPDTPNMDFDEDDLDNYRPLQRAGSKSSLYSSRSSLYGRRSKRDRKGSFTGSVGSYARDDIDAYRGYDSDNRLSHRGRAFKSLGDIGYDSMRSTRSTQTLRETATQTGSGQVSRSQPARRSKERLNRRRQTSASSTQTAADKKKAANTTDKKATAVTGGTQTTVPPIPPKFSDSGMSTDASMVRNQSAPVLPTKKSTQSFPPPKPGHEVPRQRVVKPRPQVAQIPDSSDIDTSFEQSPAQGQVLPMTSNPPTARILPTQVAKSPWEVLCELTDSQQEQNPNAMGPGSVHSGRFPTDSVHSGHSYPYPPGPAHGDQRPAGPGSVHSEHMQMLRGPGSVQSDYIQKTSRSASPRSLPAVQQPLLPQQPMAPKSDYPSKSSWEQLKELTDDPNKLAFNTSSYAASQSNV